MKYLNTLLFAFLFFPVFAQAPKTKRLQSLPSMDVGLVKERLWNVSTSPDGKRIVISHGVATGDMVIIDMDKKYGTAIEHPYVSDVSWNQVANYFSPNFRYHVAVTHGFKTYHAPKSGAAGRIEDIHQWQTRGSEFLTGDAPGYSFEVIDKYYTLAVTNEGKLITTKPSGFKKVGKYPGPLVPRKYEGLFLVDPIANTSITLSETDKLTDETRRYQSPDSKIFCWLEVVKGEKASTHMIHAFDLTTGKSWTFDKPYGETNAYRLSNTMLLSSDYVYPMPPSSHNVTLYDIKTGKVIAKENVVDDYNGSMLLTDEKLFFYSAVNFSVVELKPNGKQGLQMMQPVVLDTADLQVDPKRLYFSMRAGDQLLVLPQEYLMQRTTRGWCFDLASGKPTFVIYNLYSNIYPPSEAYTASQAAAECERVTSNLTLPVGAVLVEKGDNCQKPTAFITSYDCKTNKYEYGVIEKEGVTLTVSYSFEVSTKYQYCTSSNLRVCSNCNGKGRYKEITYEKLDKWEQTNFNVYVRDPNKVTRLEATKLCPVCGGRGVL